ncbi:hypothetical protein [Demequina sp. NBRC 110053]|uniref:hypothetical protein n=1 Tax=Demequina sp. NBRC 110053 TaxID=1570342 RepID=UPI000A0534F3|nr:hypothetical protein [Demequina sp. NBRC 110053]
MAHADGADGVLATLAKGLERDAGRFAPSSTAAHRETGPSLPGRRRGAALASTPAAPASGPASIVLECGTSRSGGFTHVLWISPSAESILGSHVAERLGEAIGGIDVVQAWTWEGLDRLHVRAPGADWDALLDAARAAVGALAR